MNRDLSNYRRSYQKDSLSFAKLPSIPLELFQVWFDDADNCDKIAEANAFSLATIGKDGFPKNRIVLMKSYSKNGFVFYTNYESEKGLAIETNNNVCMHFFWPELERQIIIKGQAIKVSDEVSNNYFNSRPLGSQLGALASNQSQKISDRRILEDKMEALKKQYEGKKIERPSNWGGFEIKAHSFEFWQGRMNRLHDRILYEFDGIKWTKSILSP